MVLIDRLADALERQKAEIATWKLAKREQEAVADKAVWAAKRQQAVVEAAERWKRDWKNNRTSSCVSKEERALFAALDAPPEGDGT